MDNEAAEAFAEAMSLCSVEDCNRLPVRTVWELDADGVIEIAMLCRQHAAVYQPEGRVISDEILPTAEMEPEVLDAQIR